MHTDSMRIVSCTRDEAEDQITDIGEGWVHLGHSERLDEVGRALGRLWTGADEVTLGHTIYRIREARAS